MRSGPLSTFTTLNCAHSTGSEQLNPLSHSTRIERGYHRECLRKACEPGPAGGLIRGMMARERRWLRWRTSQPDGAEGGADEQHPGQARGQARPEEARREGD